MKAEEHILGRRLMCKKHYHQLSLTLAPFLCVKGLLFLV